MSWFVFKQLVRGKTVIRAMMNERASLSHVSGKVIDLGGGEGSSYLNYIRGLSDSILENIDLYRPALGGKRIDLEGDKLPYLDESVDNVLLFNVLEHLFNTRNVFEEARRILKNNRKLIGFIPFLVNYHADPHDFVRLTNEALERYLIESGYSVSRVEAVGLGPFTLNLNTISSVIPGVWIAFAYPFYYAADRLLLMIRPKIKTRFPLGYYFEATK